MSRLLTLGETMAVLATDGVAPLRTARQLVLSTAGAESTVAIGLCRLGHRARWVGVVGDDELGVRVRRDLLAEGVDVALLRVDPAAPTGLMLRERRAAEVLRVHYYRSGSAGSRLSPQDVPEAALDGVDLVHLTGVTAALGAGPLAALHRAVELATERGVPVGYDVNFRSRLTTSAAAAALADELLPRLELLFVADDELALLTDLTDPAAAAQELCRRGPREVVVTLGPLGAVAATADGGLARCPAVPVPVVDVIGAGDSFAAGYLAARLDGRPLAERLQVATTCAAFTVGTAGDWEGLPRAVELGLLSSSGGVVR